MGWDISASVQTFNGTENRQAVADTPYNDAFYASHEDAVVRSARIIVPLVLQLTDAHSVIDIGCGRGAWLRAFADNGIAEIRGIDGGYVDRARLMIDPDRFTAADLRGAFEIEGRYDLAVCLEVAEHLPPSSAPTLVRALTGAAPIVLFSAAIPGQGGTDHVNEQWPEYWRKLFAERGFRILDPLRREILGDARVMWWYRQNILMFANEAAIAQNPALTREAAGTPASGLQWIYAPVVQRQLGLRYLLRQLPAAAWRSLRYRIGRKTL